MIQSVDQEYFGPEGHFEIHNSKIIFEDSHILEVECDFVGDVEVAQKIVAADVGIETVIIKPRTQN